MCEELKSYAHGMLKRYLCLILKLPWCTILDFLSRRLLKILPSSPLVCAFSVQIVNACGCAASCVIACDNEHT